GGRPGRDRGVRLFVHRHPVPRLRDRDRVERRVLCPLALNPDPFMSTASGDRRAAGTPVIELIDLSMRFRQHSVLRDINLTIHRGETVAVIGESGCGKTVLLKLMIALLKPTRGAVRFDGRDLATLSQHELSLTRLRFGFLFQMAALFDSLTVFDN